MLTVLSLIPVEPRFPGAAIAIDTEPCPLSHNRTGLRAGLGQERGQVTTAVAPAQVYGFVHGLLQIIYVTVSDVG